ncbi:MAG TPA: nucleotide disphospho-sugar-binding domain-containing protein [Mycobacteriales bacterium]|nr:nucleotide disphospho-sugar-binding domain-containing protein [Mycobacteriales bacterium]
MRVALVTGPDPGHLIPMAGLASLLQAAGHAPMVVTGRRWQQTLARSDLGFTALPLLTAIGPDEDAGYRLSARPVAMAPPLAAALRGWQPEVIVSDTLTRAGALAAGILGLPWVELVPHMLADPSSALPPFGTGWSPRPARDGVLRRLSARSHRRGLADRAAACAAAGLQDPAPALRLVATLPALEPPRPDWPADAVVVGPIGFEPATAHLALPAGDGPLIVVVGSSASQGGADLLGLAIAALRGVRLASPRFAPYGGPLPEWACAGPGRLAPLLARAALVIAPGGHGMVTTALRAGVPLVLLPGPGDQKEVAARVARLGAAERTRPGDLARSVARVQRDPGFAAAAARIGAGAIGLPDPVRLITEIGSRGA